MTKLEPVGDLAARATSVTTVAELAALLRELRRRESRQRHGRVLTYQQLVDRTGWSVGSVAAYLNGMTLPPTERFDELLRHLSARAHEHGPLATARDRVDDAQRPPRVLDGHASVSSLGWSARTAQMLPAVPRAFTGRVGALARLDTILAETAAAGAVVVTAVAGMGGVGKTTLAVQWGRSTVEHFPGGQLYVNLRGYDPAEPLSTLDALGSLLTGLGAPPSAMPADAHLVDPATASSGPGHGSASATLMPPWATSHAPGNSGRRRSRTMPRWDYRRRSASRLGCTTPNSRGGLALGERWRQIHMEDR